MEAQQPPYTGQGPTRRESEPHHQKHHHQHNQPHYADYKLRRHTDGGPLRKMHSRPEDYKNKPRSGNMVEYICFDDEDHPQDHQASRGRHQAKIDEAARTPLDRHESNASNLTSSTVLSDDSGYDSEDELTLPPLYHHDIASRDDEADRWSGCRRGACGDHNIEGYHSPDRSTKHDNKMGDANADAAAHHRYMHEHHTDRRTSSSNRDSPSPRSRSYTRTHSSSSEHSNNDELVAQVAHHLQAHRDAYGHRNTKQLVGELLCEVVRKVKDGSLDDSTMREVVREVQHVL